MGPASSSQSHRHGSIAQHLSVYLSCKQRTCRVNLSRGLSLSCMVQGPRHGLQPQIHWRSPKKEILARGPGTHVEWTCVSTSDGMATYAETSVPVVDVSPRLPHLCYTSAMTSFVSRSVVRCHLFTGTRYNHINPGKRRCHVYVREVFPGRVPGATLILIQFLLQQAPLALMGHKEPKSCL
ncbi:unnamed protein product [Boreogadus saida]